MTRSLSYDIGPNEPAVPTGTIADWLKCTAQRYGDKDALVMPEQDVHWTWSELRDKVRSLAHGLLRLGITTGDRVGICAPNCSEWVLTQLATAEIGAILVSINPAYRTHELKHALRLAGVRAIVTASKFKSSDYLGMLAEIAPASSVGDRCFFDAALPDLRHVIEIGGTGGNGAIAFDALFDHTDNNHVDVALNENDPINIQFTSGTTGSP